MRAFWRGKLVKREVAAHRRKGLGVLAQALRLEQLARKAAAREVPLARVHLPQPSFVLPRAAADVDILSRQAAQARRQCVAVEAAEVVEKRAYHACANR